MTQKYANLAMRLRKVLGGTVLLNTMPPRIITPFKHLEKIVTGTL